MPMYLENTTPRGSLPYERSGSGALRPPPPVAAESIPRSGTRASLRAPSRGDPPRWGFALRGLPTFRSDLYLPDSEMVVRWRRGQRFRRQAYKCKRRSERGQHVRGGSPRKGARSELASGAATGG